MLTLQSRLRFNRAQAAATVIEGEAIMMNLAEGIYYSTDGVGARIWELAAAGHSLEEIAAVLTAEYDVAPGQAQADVTQLAEQFVAEQLLVPAESDTTPAKVTAQGAGARYTPPTLEIYREMGHLLALDPPMPGLENITWESAPSNTDL